MIYQIRIKVTGSASGPQTGFVGLSITSLENGETLVTRGAPPHPPPVLDQAQFARLAQKSTDV